jgi:hypothetical protein
VLYTEVAIMGWGTRAVSLTTAAIVACGVLMSSAPSGAAGVPFTAGFDPGLTHRCAFTWKQPPVDPRGYADQTDCPGDPNALIGSGQMWGVGSDASGAGQSHCGGSGMPGLNAYKINDPSSPLKLGWTWAPTSAGPNGYTVDMAIAGNACASNVDLSYDMQQGVELPLAGLQSRHEIRIVSRSGVNHVAELLYVKDPVTEHKWTAGVNFLPTSFDDPRWAGSWPAGIVFHGKSERPGSHLVGLNAKYFGLPSLQVGPNAGFTSLTVNWDAVLGRLRELSTHSGWSGWAELFQPDVFARAVGGLAVEIQAFNNGRIHIQHRAWAIDSPAADAQVTVPPILHTIRSVANGLFVSAEVGYSASASLDGLLRARASVAQGWEQFVIVGDCTGSIGCAIYSPATNAFVTSQRNSALNPTLERATPGAVDFFQTVGDCKSAAGCAIRSRSNGAYLSAELGYTGDMYGAIRARASVAQSWEHFQIS